MLIPIHVSFVDLLNGHYRFIYRDLVDENSDFANRIKQQTYVLNNLTVVLGVSKRQLMRQLKKGMKHPDIPNDTRGLVKRKRDGKIDVIGLSYDVLDMVRFYQLERRSSKITGLGDEDLMERIFRQEAERVAGEQEPDWNRDVDSEPSEEVISNLADYQGELTENHYGSQSIGHSMPSERNLALGTAIIKIIKRATLLYRLALADNKNINQPLGGPNPFWLGVIMHCITDSYSTVHTFRSKYDSTSDRYFRLNWNPEIRASDRIFSINPKFRPFVARPGQIRFSKWELKSTFSLFSRCLSTYLDNHFDLIYSKLNQFDEPESLFDFIIKTVCKNYCTADKSVDRVICRVCQGSVLCRTMRHLDLFDPEHPEIETFSGAYREMEPGYDYSRMPAYYRLEHFRNFVTGPRPMSTRQHEIRSKVIETVNRLLFFKFRERELNDLFKYPKLQQRYRDMMQQQFTDVNLGQYSDQQLADLAGGGSLWDAFKSTVNDIFQTATSVISRSPKLSGFKFYPKSDILRDASRRQLNQSYIIDFHDYERQHDPPDLHMRCDYVQHPSLLEEIYDNLIHLTELYSHHINYLYKLRIKSGQNIRNTFYSEYAGDITRIGDAHPDYAIHSAEEYNERMRKCLEEFYQYIYRWVYKINSQQAFDSEIKRFTVNAETCLAQSELLADSLS